MAGFTIVSHRRKRKTGVPVLLQPTMQPPAGGTNRGLQSINPITLSKAVADVAGAAPVRHRFTARGGLLVDVATEEQVNLLLCCENLCGTPITAKIPGTYQRTTGLIKGVPKWYSNSELQDFLGDQGVNYARRLVQHHKGPGDEIKIHQTDRVVLTFAPNSERPRKVNLGFTIHEVLEYTETPSRCFKCQRFGHIAKYCHNDVRCKNCGGPHDFKSCKEESRKCSNCGGPHPASFSGCKGRQQALRRTQTFLHGTQNSPKELKGESFHTQDAEPRSQVQDTAEAAPAVDSLIQKIKTQLKGPRTDPSEPQKKKGSPEQRPKQRPKQETSSPPSRDNGNNESYQKGKRNKPDVEAPKRKASMSCGGSHQSGNGTDIIAALFVALRSIITNMQESTSKEALQAILTLESVVLTALSNGLTCSCHA